MLGRPCPIPVAEAKKALSRDGASGDSSPGVIVLVDNMIAVQNLEKMAKGLGYRFSWQQNGESEYAAKITAKKPDSTPAEMVQPPEGSCGVTFLITSDQIGLSDAEPGKKLMQSFLHSLVEASTVPDTLLLVNAGVKLAVQGSPALDDLHTLAAKGTNVLSCGQCLAYYGLTEKLAAGTITNMLEIVDILNSAPRTITI